MIKIAVVIEKCEEGGYTISVPTLPGCLSEGETIDEAMENIVDAIEMRLEPTVDDLILDESFIVKELEFHLVRPASPESPAARPDNGSERPTMTSSPRSGRVVELKD